ncbi:Amine oxidase, partial [Trinorchestia longiramus]
MAEAVREVRVKVCIIGCGVSGAAAAGELVAAGMTDVVVVEASGRPGGRVHTISLGDSHLEMGANWLHGQTGNCVYEWAKQHCPQRLMLDPDPCTEDKDSSMFIDPHGSVLPEDLVKVCIIGCGVSGAAAAGELVAAGMTDVVVVEAAGRPGGRVHTISLGDSHLEMGANWLHGQTGNCVYEWAKQHCPQRLMLDPDPCTEDKDSSMFIDPHGSVLPEDLVAEIQDCITEIEEGDMTASDGSLGDYFQHQWVLLLGVLCGGVVAGCAVCGCCCWVCCVG